ncbi:MAG: hypothetical protein H7141_04200 [Burkholderiales bacterium]|nr:hypothetical protein [Bacteroidia bacterium]
MNTQNYSQEIKQTLENKFKLSALSIVQFPHEKYKVQTSVDFSIEHKNITYLFDIESYNTPKVALANYVLLNNYMSNHAEIMFVNIQCAKGFNTSRTVDHLNFAQRKFGCKVPFKVFDGITFQAMVLQSRSLDGLMIKINAKVKPIKILLESL